MLKGRYLTTAQTKSNKGTIWWLFNVWKLKEITKKATLETVEVEPAHQTFGNHKIMDGSQWVCMYDSEIDYVPYKTIFNHRNMLCTTLYRSFLQWATAMSCTVLKQKWRSKISKTTTSFCSQHFISILNPLEIQSANMYIHFGFATTPFLDIPPPDFLSTRIGISSSLPWLFGVSNMPAVTGDWMTCFPEVQCEFAGRDQLHRVPNCQLVGLVR